jgi:hypothetical protein
MELSDKNTVILSVVWDEKDSELERVSRNGLFLLLTHKFEKGRLIMNILDFFANLRPYF